MVEFTKGIRGTPVKGAIAIRGWQALVGWDVLEDEQEEMPEDGEKISVKLVKSPKLGHRQFG